MRSVVSKMPKADDALFKTPTSPFFVKQLGGNLVPLFVLRFDMQCSSYSSTPQFRNCSAAFEVIVTKGVNVSMNV